MNSKIDLLKKDTSNYLVLDFETTNIDKGDPVNPANEMVLACWVYKGKRYHSWQGEYKQWLLLRHIQEATILVAHNAKFELGWLKRCGLDIEKPLLWDTMIAEKIIVSNTKASVSLDATLGRYGLGNKESIVGTLMKAGICSSDIPRSMLLRYCFIDVLQTERLYLKQKQRFNDKQINVLYTRSLLTPVLADIETKGMYLDKEKVTHEYTEESKRYGELSRRFQLMSGDINPRSSKQMAEFLYKGLGFSEPKDRRGNPIRTAAGGRKTDQATIAGLKATNKQQREFLECFKELKKSDTRLNKYLTKFQQAVENDHLLFAGFNQTATDTQRLSSNGKAPYKIQFQNISRDYKRLFKSRHYGWKIGAVDYGQLEFRVAAFLGKDERAIEDIRTGFDVHSYTASIIFKKDLQWILDNKNRDPVAKDMRQRAKANTFKPTFGGTSGTKDEQAYFKAFKQKYSSLARTQQHWVNTVVNNKEIETVTGVKFFFPDCKITSSGYVFRNEQIHNYPIQSFAAAEIVSTGVMLLWHRMKELGMKSFLVNTVHDSVVAEVAPGEEEQWTQVAETCLTEGVVSYLKDVYDIDFNVPLEVDVTISNHWSG